MQHADISREFNLQCRALLDQSLQKIVHCLEQIEEHHLWYRPVRDLNSIGNLLLHINGNLRQWAIASLTGGTDVRQRDREFLQNAQGTVNELLDLTVETVSEATVVIASIPADRLLDRVVIQGFDVSVMQAVMHTTTHFQGHTHQIIMLTRWQLGERYRYHWTPDSVGRDLPM